MYSWLKCLFYGCKSETQIDAFACSQTERNAINFILYMQMWNHQENDKLVFMYITVSAPMQ